MFLIKILILISMSFNYEYPRALNTVDAIIISKKENKILLIKRLNEPFKNFWALPGGFIEMEVTLLESVKREVLEETSLDNINLREFKVYGDPGRDPRGRTITFVYYGYCDSPELAQAGDDAKELAWFSLNELPDLAFDHKKIIDDFLSLLI
jgi:8-oxo-dGTP diphosphatase